MKLIYNYAIAHTDSNELKSNLIDVLNNINDDKIERFINMVLNCMPTYSLPVKVYNYNRTQIRIFKSFDYLNDKIDYTYEETITKFFKNQEDANKYATTGEYMYSRSSSSKSNEYNIKNNYTYHRESHMSIAEWLSCEVVKD